jgi:hypothetical protein
MIVPANNPQLAPGTALSNPNNLLIIPYKRFGCIYKLLVLSFRIITQKIMFYTHILQGALKNENFRSRSRREENFTAGI